MSRRSVRHAAVAVATGLALTACGGGTSTSAPREVRPYATVADLSQHGGTTRIAVSAKFVAAVRDAGLTPSTTGPARYLKAGAHGTLALPVSGGWLRFFRPGAVSDDVIGQVQHETSGLALSRGTTTVVLADLDVDPGIGVAYGDVVVRGGRTAPDIPVLDVDASHLEVGRAGAGGYVLDGLYLTLDARAAAVLDEELHTHAFTAGLPLGTAQLTVRG